MALLVVGIGASLGGPTGYAINPARDLGPRIAHAILPIKGKGSRTGATPGCRSSARSSAAFIAALLFKAIGAQTLIAQSRPRRSVTGRHTVTVPDRTPMSRHFTEPGEYA